MRIFLHSNRSDCIAVVRISHSSEKRLHLVTPALTFPIQTSKFVQIQTAAIFKKKVHETLFRLTFNLSFCYRFWSSLPSSMISHSKLFKMFFQTYSHNFLFKKIRITFCETSEKTSWVSPTNQPKSISNDTLLIYFFGVLLLLFIF